MPFYSRKAISIFQRLLRSFLHLEESKYKKVYTIQVDTNIIFWMNAKYLLFFLLPILLYHSASPVALWNT